MTRPPSIPADLWASFPPAAQAVMATQADRIARLEARLAEREARLNQNSANSSRPPSTDPPHAKPAPPRTPSGKAKGGQRGHPKNYRPLLPPDVVVPRKPVRCRRCSHRLTGDDSAPLVHQVHEIPEVRPHVTEYRRHRLACPGCGAVTRAPLPAAAQTGYGPRTPAVCALLAAGHRLGKRAVAQAVGDLFGLILSPAAVCDLHARTAAALAPIHAEALDAQLYLPQAWADDADRMARAGVPAAVGDRPKWQMALAMLRQAAGHGFRGVVLADSLFGTVTEFREQLAADGRTYCVGIDSTLKMVSADADLGAVPPRGRTGRPPTRLAGVRAGAKSPSVKQWAVDHTADYAFLQDLRRTRRKKVSPG